MKLNENILNLLKTGAKEALNNNEIPVCAVIVDENDKIIIHSINDRQSSCSVLGHAEISAILLAEKIRGDWRLNGCKMYVNLEPCDMCSMVIKECRLDKVYYFIENNSVDHSNNLIDKSLVVGYESDKVYFNNLLTMFFNNMR